MPVLQLFIDMRQEVQFGQMYFYMPLSGETTHVSEAATAIEQMLEMLKIKTVDPMDSRVEGPFQVKSWFTQKTKPIVYTFLPAMVSTVEKAGWEVVSHGGEGKSCYRNCTYLFKPTGA